MTSPATPDRGRGLYETLLIAEERPVALARHLERLGASAREKLGAELPADLAAGAAGACAGIALGRLRLELLPAEDSEEGPRDADAGGEGAALRWEARAEAIDPAEFFPLWERGARLRTVAAAEWSGAHKWADRDWLEAREAELGEAVPLLLGGDGLVLEAARANVFCVVDGALATPPLDGRILPGTGRAATIELAGELGLEVAARPLSPADLHAAGEVFLTSSVRGIRPARSLDGAELPGHATTDRLSHALRERWLSGD